MNLKNIEPRYKKLFIVIIPLIILFFVFGFLTYRSATNLLGASKPTSDKTYDIDEYDYHLRSNATELQVSLFNELKSLIKEGADDTEIASCIVKNYVADAYTWDNKKSQWDVGGMCYIYSPMKNNFYLQFKDKFYGLLDKYQRDSRQTDGLLEVSSVEIISSAEASSLFEVDGNEYRSFNVVCSWEYTDDSKYANKIDKRMYFEVIKNNDNRFEIANSYEG